MKSVMTCHLRRKRWAMTLSFSCLLLPLRRSLAPPPLIGGGGAGVSARQSAKMNGGWMTLGNLPRTILAAAVTL